MICGNCLALVVFHTSGFCSRCRFERYVVWGALVLASLFIAVMLTLSLRNVL